MLIVSSPPLTDVGKLIKIAMNPMVGALRYNIGMRSPFSPRETLEKMKNLAEHHNKKLYIDIKGRQLKIEQWARPTYGDIILNHNVKVDGAAPVHFRGVPGIYTLIKAEGKKIFVTPQPTAALGAGQSVNILGNNVSIDGYLTDEDVEYIKACEELELCNILLSFVETTDDIQALTNLHPMSSPTLKIESNAGVQLIRSTNLPTGCHLMFARDDMMIHAKLKFDMINIAKLIIEKDPEAIVASQLLTSLVHGNVTAADISDIYLLKEMGYKHFMLSDTISHFHFPEALDIFETMI